MKNPNRLFLKLLTLIILTSLFLLPVFQTQAETLVIPTKWVTNALKAVKLADLLNDAKKLGNAAKLLNRSQSVGELKDVGSLIINNLFFHKLQTTNYQLQTSFERL